MKRFKPNGNFVQHEPCSKCGSSDAGSRYDNGDLHCFACNETIERGGTITAQEETVTDWTPAQGECVALAKRGLTKETCAAWQYQVGEYKGKAVQIANFLDAQRKLVCQKMRTADKQFPSLGATKNKPLYGIWRFPQGGKYITITEGELDALSVSQAFDNKYAVVSLPDGATSAEKVLSANYDYLDRFDNIVLMFDMDDPGREAATAAAMLLPAGKVLVASLPEKDANEVLLKHGPGVLAKCFWQAAPWKPDGIIDGEEITLADVMTEVAPGMELPYPMLQEKILGLRKGELTLLTAGSGIGKSTLARELAYHMHQSHGARIANVYLEEQYKKTAQGYIAIHNNVPLGKLRHNKSLITEDQWREGLIKVVQQRMFFYNHFGSLESTRLLSKLRYFATVKKCDFIVLDHISIVTSGMESSSEGERKDIDILMTRLRQLVEETGVGVIAIVHLKRVNGKNFNEGAQVSLSDLRGSASLEQLSDNVIALERDQQDPEVETKMRVRILKCRELGETGEADMLNYNRKTGRIELAAADVFPDEDLEAADKDKF